MIGYHHALIAVLALHASSRTASAQVDPEDHQIFADELTALLYKNANECSSALGVSMAFSLIYPGCTNDAVKEVKDTFGYPGGDNLKLVWEDTTERMLDSASGDCAGEVSEWDGVCYSEAPLLKIANSVWLDNNDTLNEEYEDVVGDLAMQTDFSATESPLIVNEWVKNSTNALIDEIVDPSKPLFPPDVLIAINSIYLKAQWVEQFEERLTTLDTFYSSASRETDVSKAHFMHMVDTFEYSHEALEGYQVLDMPFKESSMSMIFVLPLSDGAAKTPVTSSDLIWAMDDLEETRMALSVPKFKFESEYGDSLKQALFDLGIESPFTQGTESLCGIFQEDTYNCTDLIITKVIQKTLIDVNEKGVEAAAVTAVSVGLTFAGPPPADPTLMILDHPFQFFIYDKEEELMLFEGHLGAPAVPEGTPAVALLGESHADSEFWMNTFYVNTTIKAPVPDATTTPSTTTMAPDATTTEEPETTTAAPADTTAAAATTTDVANTTAALPAASIDPSEHQEFADKLTAILYTKANECSSSLGVSMAFSLVWPGCMGDAIEQVRDTLRYPNGTNMQLVWEETTTSMLASSNGEGNEGMEAPLLQIANSVWFDDGETLNQEYELVVGDYATQTDFSADKSGVVVNEWVEESTNGLIKTIVPTDEPLFPPYALLAINSIYFKARWAKQFEYRNTNLDTFYSSPAKTQGTFDAAHFMNMVDFFQYSHEALPGYQVIDLPFGSSQMSMIFVLPMNDEATAVNSTDLISVMSDGLNPTRVALSIPKFRFESEYDALKDSLMTLGIESPFTEGTGALCGLFEDTKDCEKIIVDKVIQKTVIDVNEKGVEAAAVTAVMAGVTSMPTEVPTLMTLNHPFQFFIYDKEQELMLFEGRLGAPEVPAAKPVEALLEAVHLDSDFWSEKFGLDVDPAEPTAPEPTTTAATTTGQATTSAVATSQATTTKEPAKTTEASVASTSKPTDAAASSSTAATAITMPDATETDTTSTTAAEVDTTTTSSTAAAITITTSTTTSKPPEPEPDSSSNMNSHRLSAMWTFIFLAYASVYAW